MGRAPSPAAGFPAELRDLFFFNSRWHEITREAMDRAPAAIRPPAACSDPVRMHFVDEGDDDAHPVVCVHGNPSWSFMWRGLIARLRDRYRVIAPDHVGMGWSDKPARWSYRLGNHVSNLEDLIESLGLRDITLVVHDWGGPIGLGYAVRHPENVKRIVVLNTAAWRSTRLPKRISVCRWPLVGPLAVRGFNGFARAAITQATEQPGGLKGAVRTGYLFPYSSWANRVGIQRFVEDIPMRPGHPSWPALLELEEGLPLLADKPMLLGWGMKDWCFAPDPYLDGPDGFVARFPNADVRRYESAGHYVIEDAADELLPAIDEFIGS